MEKQMKIYEIGTGYTPIPAKIGAATEIVVEELTKSFLKQKIPVEIIDIASESRPQTALPIREVKVPKRFSGTDLQLGLMHKLKRIVYSISLARTLKKLLRQTEERVVLHFHNQYNLFFFLKLVPKRLRRKCRIAYTNHSGVWRQEWEKIEETIHKRYFQEAECMKKADIVYVLNQETKKNVMEQLGVEEQRIVVINNGVNTDLYHPLTAEEKQRAKEKYGLQGSRVVLQVGSVYDNKGQLRAVEYLRPLMKKHPELIYVYAGGIVDESYQQRITEFAEQNGLRDQVRYFGMISPGIELNELYNTAAVTLAPSIYEGFSLVTIESCAAGIPVLVERTGRIHVLKGCIAFDSEDFEAIAEKLIYEDSAELSAAVREDAVRNFSWDKTAMEYLRQMQ